MVSDEALYARLVDGDESAFDELYRRYEGCLFGFLVRQLGDRADAEDVFHEAFMSVLRERRAQGKIQSFKAWIFQVARNLCHNRARSRSRALRAVSVEASTQGEQVTPHSALEDREAPRALDRAAARLPEALRSLYDLRAAGLSYDEIAATLTVPVGTVKSRMHELVRRLRQEMEPWIAR